MIRILIVEDNDLNSDMLSRRLRRRGFLVDVAGDGPNALRTVASTRPDIILMDLSLPEIDGAEVTRRLKASPQTCTIPILALTAHAMAEDRQTAFDAGCDEFDTKPVNMNRLLKNIHRLLTQE